MTAVGWPERPGDRRGAFPPRPRPPPPPRAAGGRPGRGSGGGGGAARDAGDGAGMAEAAAGAVAVVPAGRSAAGAAAAVSPRGGTGGGEVGSKRPSSFPVAAPRAHPPPKRRLVSATRRFPPGCGRGGADGGSRLVAAPARSNGGSAASPKPPPPPRSVAEAGSGVLAKASAVVVPRPVADGGRRGPDAGAQRSPKRPRHSGAAAADSLLDTDPQGGAGRGGELGSSKQLVPATRLLPEPRMVSAIRSFPRTESKESSTARGSFGPKKEVVVKDPAHLRLKVASACTMGTINKLNQVVASMLEDDGFLKAIDAYDRKLELKLNVSSDAPSVSCQGRYGTQKADARREVKKMCMRFQFICRAIVQFVEQRSLKISRIDLAADKVIKELPGFTQHEPIIGNVPGVEVGDEFLYRVELVLVGLHRQYQGGIDTTRDENGVLFAISIVASGGYPDELSSSGELVYTGSGGKYAGKKTDENQQLKRGNLALKNCIQTETPVRVIHGFKGLSREEGSHSRAKKASGFTYDGLYHVVDCWREGQAGSKVFKYKLQRIPGQPELPHCSKTARRS
ncbi:hypothetical protein PVAP13_6NG168324 [Panicum virgatum]|uniref:YDG domain-containing protein n=2 Tax=Panicum virgatum TaxID=38727 RepID=A0A8T0R016_PANVG|nr:hypothetical protein PVAP13_6NG168324 [Panicum virgatum]